MRTTTRSVIRLGRRGPAAWIDALRERLALPPGDLLRDAAYRRLFASILIASFGGQITLLALPLTAAVLLNASPLQMGLLTASAIAPFVLLSLPAGVWLDRVRKLPVYVAGELTLALAVLTIPVAWFVGWLTMEWLYVVGFLIGAVNTVAGSAAQIVLTQVVPRERLVEAHAKNALASSGAEVAGPGVAGLLIKAVGAPFALIVDALLGFVSALILRGLKVTEAPPRRQGAGGAAPFWADLREGLRFVRHQPLLLTMALVVGGWQMAHHAAIVVQILFATRTLGLSERGVGLSYVALGVGTVLASLWGHTLSQRFGPGPMLIAGVAASGVGWLVLSVVPATGLGVAVFAGMLGCFGFGAVLIFINFLSLRQAVTPAPLLGRMTSTMRWLILLPPGPGALTRGVLGEHASLRASLAFAGGLALAVALAAWRVERLRQLRRLPEATEEATAASGAATPVAPLVVPEARGAAT